MEKKKKLVSLYLTENTIKKAKIFCALDGNMRVNDFYVKAIEEKLEREGAK